MDIGEKKGNDIAQEIMAYSEYIDNLLGHIPELRPKYLPVSETEGAELINEEKTKVNDLMDSLRDGILFGYILEQINPGSIDLSKLNKNIDLSGFDNTKEPITAERAKVIFKVTGNHNIVLESAKKCGIVVVNVGPEDILNKNVGLVLGLLWQMIRCILLSDINIESHPELILSLNQDETLDTLYQLSNEQLLLRWVNYHLKYSGTSLQISNFSKDICDSEAYLTLLERINLSGPLNDDIIQLTANARSYPKSEKEKRAECVLKIAKILGCKRFISTNRIVNGHARLNLGFVATVFNKYSTMNLSDEEAMAAVKELIRRIKLKDKNLFLPTDEEFKYLHDMLNRVGYLDCDIDKLYGERIGYVDWLNELSLFDTTDYKEKEILHEMSEIEKRDEIISNLRKTCENNDEKINKLNNDVENLSNEKTQNLETISKYEDEIKQKDEKIKDYEEKLEFNEITLRNYEEKLDKQSTDFNTFKKNVTDQLKIIESLMSKNIKRSSISGENVSSSQENEEEGAESNGDNDSNSDKNPLDMYVKVEEYVKRLLDELKKSKEQNYIYKSQILQNDKINAILNEKIIEYSENACKESNIKSTKAKKKFLPS